MAFSSLPRRSTLVAMAAGAALAVGAGGLAIALTTTASADSSSTPAPSASSRASGQVGPGTRSGGHDHRGGMRGFGVGAGGAVLHGELVLRDGTSGTRTVLVQRGEVTAVTSSTVTLRSSDGFTVTWTVNAQTRGGLQGVATGDQVGARGARTAAGAATAEALHEVGDRPDRGQGPGAAPGARRDQDGHGHGRRGASPAPTTPSSTSSTATPTAGT